MYQPGLKARLNCRQLWHLFAALTIVTYQTTASAVEYESPEEIHHTVQSWLNAQFSNKDNIEFRVGHIDSRHHMIKCTHALEVNRPEHARENGNSTVKVKCNDRNAWQVYVPVRIYEYVDVLVAKHALPRGSYLQKSDVITSRKDISRLHGGYFTNLNDISDMVIKRSLRKGRVLTPGVISPPRLVKRGESVTILAKSGGLTIRVKGRALMDGKKGDRIRVKNMRSKRDLHATVVSSGTVQVNM
jgi:flagella basal body P-ring formation protein FlgA